MEAALTLLLSSARVEVRDGGVRIDGLTVDDRTLGELVERRLEQGVAGEETVRDALEIGARVLDREATGAEVDFVRREFEKLSGEVERSSGRPGLVDGSDAGSEPLEEGDDRPDRLTAQTSTVKLAGASVEDSRVGLACVDIETWERRSLHVPAPPIGGVSAGGPSSGPVPDGYATGCRLFNSESGQSPLHMV